MDALKKFLQSAHPVDDAILDEFFVACELVEVPKRQILTSAGQVQRDICFVLEGIQKSYYLAEGKEHVMAFTYPPSLTGIPESFFSQTPSRYFLETLTDSRLLKMSYERYAEFLETCRPLETMSRKLTEMVLDGVVERLHEFMAQDMETRFRTFTQRSPHLLQMVNHKDLASYLRMDATNFSRLLGKVRI